MGTFSLVARADRDNAVPEGMGEGNNDFCATITVVGGSPTCGDGSCNGGETCASCSTDCGTCGPICGDGSCNGGETCSSCANDCGVCGPACGDGTCNGGETCGSCSQDCGTCAPYCGDGSCNGSETCNSCASDCGACPGAPDLIVDRIRLVGGSQTVIVRNGESATLQRGVAYTWTAYTRNVGVASTPSGSDTVTIVGTNYGQSDCSVDGWDYSMGSVLRHGSLGPGAEFSGSSNWSWNSTGDFSLVARADRDDTISEGSGEGNNDFCVTLHIQP